MSSYGIPVILDDSLRPMGYDAGLRAALQKLDWSRDEFAKRCGYKSSRSVEKFFQGVVPPATTLNMLGAALDRLR